MLSTEPRRYASLRISWAAYKLTRSAHTNAREEEEEDLDTISHVAPLTRKERAKVRASEGVMTLQRPLEAVMTSSPLRPSKNVEMTSKESNENENKMEDNRGGVVVGTRELVGTSRQDDEAIISVSHLLLFGKG